ncbi:tyrosine-protein phosphatase [Pseudomaricurvus sp. HS19]|uniref:tyrosine-protein phosphatase n=1 Tax=Pseudomaricurvus sp. HS19 TaxID=2692626 RepID=UPI0013680D62|nr:tyrosine-protein phosphatase [Pseudomaricurvus sp. HS19]MYM63802.1 protein-tyrosine-phosphatase [Pseudomaricurvus sp. HS19]
MKLTTFKTPLAVAATLALLQGCSPQEAPQAEAPSNNINNLAVSYDAEQHSYSLSWQADDPQQQVSVLVSENPEYTDGKVVAGDVKGTSFQWQAGEGVNRYYFKVLPGNGHAAEASSRWLPLEGGKNFRDLGGYVNADGQQVRWGKLFRTGALTGLTDADYKELQEAGIATVVDFRTAPERSNEPTHWQGDGTDILSWEYDLGMDSFGRILMDPEATPEKVEAAMAAMYPQILENLDEQYTTMFDRLAASDQAMIFHCTAGKDRTGIAAALILTTLGVDRDTIEQDFMLSEVYYTTMTDARKALGGVESQGDHGDAGGDAHGDEGKPQQDPRMAMMAKLPKELLAPLTGVRMSYIDTTLDYMEQQSGSALAYIQQNLDVTDEELQQIRAHFLEPRP